MPNLKLPASAGQIHIRTRRLEIRPFRASDVKAWAKVRRERRPQQNEFDKGPPPEHTITREFFLGFLKKAQLAMKNDSCYWFGIFHRRTGESLGVITVRPERLLYQTSNFGYNLDNQHWGQGYATEALKASIPVLLKKLQLHRLDAGIEPNNRASIALVKRAGMKLEGRRKGYIYLKDRWQDLVYYVAHAEDYGIQMKPSVRMNLPEFA